MKIGMAIDFSLAAPNVCQLMAAVLRVASESSPGAAAGYVEAPLGAIFLVLPSYADNRLSDYHLQVDETDLFYKDLAK